MVNMKTIFINCSPKKKFSASAYFISVQKFFVKGEAVNDSSKLNKKQPKKVSKIGRNEMCPCGSGKKYKNCCLRGWKNKGFIEFLKIYKW